MKDGTNLKILSFLGRELERSEHNRNERKDVEYAYSNRTGEESETASTACFAASCAWIASPGTKSCA